MSKEYLVVGGSSGIGLQLAKNLSDAGNKVHVLSRTEGRLGELSGVTHDRYDVSTDDEVPFTTDKLEGVVYAPGTINLKPFHRLKINDFQHDFQVNVLGAVRVLQQALPLLKKGEHPSVVLFSTVAVQQGMGFHASIASSKGAIEGLTRSLAAEWAPAIRVNCIAPSVTDTPLAERLLATEEKKKASGNRHALHRVGTPADIADLATFLLSEKAGWITGQVMGVDGGMSTLRSL